MAKPGNFTKSKFRYETGLTMELCTEAAKYATPHATELLDIGCGAGNYTLKMLSKIPDLNCVLNDLSMPMLQKAKQRVSAAATLYHLRDDEDWELMFAKIYKALRPGGSFWVSDLIAHHSERITKLFEDKYSSYLESLGGPEYRQKVLDYVQYEDTPAR